jgi:hypothetical protein
MSQFVRRVFLVAVVQTCSLIPALALAQNWSFDARNVGMGGVGSTNNIAQTMIDEERTYKAIVLPFGLLQVLPNLPKLDPTKDDFDLVRAIEYGASPIHFIVGRDDTKSGSAFVNDLRNGTLNRDLNTYDFSPATSITAEGLASPNWGHTFKLASNPDGSFHGIYAGAGPYFSMRTSTAIDPALAAIFSSPTPVYVPNTSFYMSNDTESQFALAITGGYRGRFGLPTSTATDSGSFNRARDGLYVGANFNYLHGFSYEHFLPSARIDTNAQGLATVNPAKGLPVTIVRDTSTSGTGLAVDVGVAAVVNHWEVGLGVNGIANRITWTGAEQTNYVLNSLFSGGEFVDLPTVPLSDVRVELPVDTRANATYNADVWTGTTEYGHGYNGNTFRAGYERRLDRVQLRAGARYIKERWEPTGGVGYNLSDRVGLDVGLFSTSANFERKRHLAIAVSLRFMTRTFPMSH